jgi:hypothetical protein
MNDIKQLTIAKMVGSLWLFAHRADPSFIVFINDANF